MKATMMSGKLHLSQAKQIFTAILGITLSVSALASTPASKHAIDRRLAHARELLGPHYAHSVVRRSEKVADISTQVYTWTREALPAKFKHRARAVAKTILSESNRHGFDPIFLMAVIKGESDFDPEIRGDAGEIGLMQILPRTARWMGEIEGWKWKNTTKTLLDPVMNVKIGAAYLAHLRKQFDSHGRLYLSAYNMGPTNVNRALSRQVWPKDYPMHVMEKYIEYYRELRKLRG